MSPVKLRCEEKLRNRHFAEWRFRPLMRIVTVNPKIWKVNVIGIGTPPLQRIPGKTARRCFGPLGVQKEPYLFYQTGRKMSINGVCCAIGKRKAWHSIQQEGAAGKRSAPSGDFAVCRRDCVRLFRFCLTGSSAHRIPAAGERRKAPQAPGQSRRCGRPRYAAI